MRLFAGHLIGGPMTTVLLCAGYAAAGDPPLFVNPSVLLANEPSRIASLDANDDGLIDLVVLDIGGGLEFIETMSPLGLQEPVRVATAWGSYALVTGDFDSDGEADVATIGLEFVDVFLGHGDGTFDAGLQQHLTGGTGAVAVDADADGNLDLLLANYPEGVTSALGDGAGGFHTEQVLPLAGADLAAGDVDADGFVDFAAGSLQTGATSIVRGTGGGQFVPWKDYPTAAVSDVALEHLDGDGWLDFAWSAGYVSPITVQLSQGAGLFGAPSPPTGFSQYWGFLAADFDEDGDLDLLGAGTPSWNDGSGSFAVDPDLDLELVPELAADLDGDGAIDVVSATHDDGYGYPNGSLYVIRGLLGPEFEHALQSPAFPDVPEAFFLADVDSTGGADVVIADLTQVHVLPGLGDGHFGEDVLSKVHTGQGSCIALAGGDFDGDGLGDLLGAYDKKQFFNSLGIRFLRGAGDGSVVPAIDSPTPGKVHALEVADLDLDGDLDAVARKSAVATTLLNDGTGKLQDDDVAHGESPIDLAAGDADGDGLPDLALLRSDDLLRMLPGLGGGQFGNPLDLEVLLPQGVALGDIDGDGREEIAVDRASASYAQADLSLVRLQAGTGLVVLEELDIAGLGPGGSTLLTLRDVSGDGFGDVVCASPTDVTVLLSDGEDGLLPARSFFTGAGQQRLGLIDGDGRLDVVTLDLSSYFATQVRTSLGQALGPWTDLGHGLAGAKGMPVLDGSGSLLAHSSVDLQLAHAAPQAAAWLVIGSAPALTAYKGGTLVPLPSALLGGLVTDVHGRIHLAGSWPDGVPADSTLYVQAWIADASGPAGFAASNGLQLSPP